MDHYYVHSTAIFQSKIEVIIFLCICITVKQYKREVELTETETQRLAKIKKGLRRGERLSR